MGVDSCDIPDNTFTGLDISLPNELSSEVSDEARSELLDCFIESLNIESGSDVFTDIFKKTLRDFGGQEFRQISIMDERYINYILYQAVQIYYEYIGTACILDPNFSYITIRGVCIDFSQIKRAHSNERENNIGAEYTLLEGEEGFQESFNNGMTLNDALDKYGLSEYILSSLPVIFHRELSEQEIQQLILMIKYTTSIESRYGYNLTRQDIPECPSGYFQYQICDGIASKEVYDYETETFSDAGEWGSNDREVVDHKGDDKRWVRRVWKDSSYDTALRSLPDDIREGNSKFSRDYENIGNPDSQNFSFLNSQEQIVLFFSDSMNKPGAESYFNRLFSGDKTAIVDMYITNHNTNPEDDSERSKNIYSVIRARAMEILDISYP